MEIPRTTHDVLESLTPREAKVLRRRFGLDEEDLDSNISGSVPPSGGWGNNGNGGVPAPAKPPN